MDDFKKGPGQGFSDFDDIEIIDATGDDVIEIVDPYESEVIEINVQRNEDKKKGTSGQASQAPDKKIMDADFDAFNPSRTVILNKGDKDGKGGNGQSDAPKKFVATPPNGKIQDAPPATGGYKPPTPMGKIVVPESIDVGGSTTTILKKGTPKEEDKKAGNGVNTSAAKAATAKKYDGIDLDEFDDLPPVDYTAKAKTGTQTPPPAKSKSAVNTSLAGAKSASRVNPLFSGSDTEETEKEKPKSIMEQVKSGYVEVAGKRIPLKPVGIGLAAIIVLILLISIFTGNNRVKVSMNSYVSFSFEGFDGTATPVVNIDYEKLAKDLGNKVEVKSSKTLEDVIKENVSYSFDKTENLSNGEVINFTWNWNNEAFENATNATFIGDKKKRVNVTGVAEIVKDYNLFANVSCKYSGYSGEGILDLSASDEKFPELTYTADKTTDICNDDEITINVSVEGVEDLAAYFKAKGYEMAAFSTKVTASGLAEFEIYDIFANVNLAFAGYDGIGTATVSGNPGLGNLSYTLETVKDLSNGDKITVKVVSNDDQTVQQTVHANHYSISSETKEFTVAGLTETKDYDPFSEIEFKYTGTSPDGILSLIDSNFVSVDGLEFTADKNSPLANGDSIEVTISCKDGSDPAKLCLASGYKLSSLKKTFTVDGLPYYLDKVADIDEESQEKYKEQCTAIMDGIIASDIGRNLVKDIELSSIYVQYPQSREVIFAYNETWKVDIRNRLIMVYKVEIDDGDGSFTFYWPIKFVNVIVNSDGKLESDLSMYIALPNTFQYHRKNIPGYETMEEFLSSLDEDSTVYDYDFK